MPESIIENRAFERISTNIWTGIMHSSENIICSGIINDCSEKGMYIRGCCLFLFDSKVEMLIPLEKEILRVPVRVARAVMKGNIYEGIGVEILNSSQDVINFVHSLKTTF